MLTKLKVTKEYQIGRARINGSFYLFVDTPGLDDPFISNAAILAEIARLLYLTKDSVVYAGVIYVHPVTCPFSDEMRKGLQFLEAFCGLDYAPSITFVTTMWDLQSPQGVRRSERLFNELIAKRLSSFMERGAKIYHHGRRYENGDLTLDVLDLEEDGSTRQSTAREIISIFYPIDLEYPTPLIVQELRANILLQNTTVGKFLGMTSMELVPVVPTIGDSRQPGGFDWLGSLVGMLKIPVQMVGGLVMALWVLLDNLQSRLSSTISRSNIGISLHHLGSSRVEALLSLPGGLKFIVGYGPSGPYWRPWASRDEHEAGFRMSDDDFESDTEEDSAQNGRVYENPEHVAFGELFDEVSSDVRDRSIPEPEPTPPHSDWSLWEKCAVM